MACRSLKRAEAARKQLYQHLELDIAQQKQASNYDGHAELFKSNLQINIHEVDLSSFRSVIQFCREIDQRLVFRRAFAQFPWHLSDNLQISLCITRYLQCWSDDVLRYRLGSGYQGNPDETHLRGYLPSVQEAGHG